MIKIAFIPVLLSVAIIGYIIHKRMLNGIDSVRGGALTELVYNVDMKNPNKKQEFLGEIKKLNDNLNVTLITGYNTTDL